MVENDYIRVSNLFSSLLTVPRTVLIVSTYWYSIESSEELSHIDS